MLRISGWKRQSVRKLAKPKTVPRNNSNQNRDKALSKSEKILNAYERQVNQHLMISKEGFLVFRGLQICAHQYCLSL